MAQAIIRSTRPSTENRHIFSIFRKAAIEYRKTQQMFEMMGWGELPEELKLTIEQDVKGYVDELEGSYCTSCAYVQRRRKRVDYWVNCFLDGICSEKTAVDALRVKPF
ncbi:MAG: hypothetical protein JJU46_14500 [Balneolaceae bacterium]|nr:hypothetical protein [Balneolaceae bacterium]MCH8547504.1 hypothetical protein [Balneolaceae bacterium]